MLIFSIFTNESFNEDGTYNSPPAASNPTPRAAIPATTPPKLSPYASEFIPPTHLYPILASTLPSSPPILSPIRTQEAQSQKHSPTVPTF